MEKVKEDFYKSALIHIKKLRAVQTEADEILEIYENVFIVQQRAVRSFRPDINDFDAELCRSRNAEGLPILRAEDIKIDQSLSDRVIKDLCRIIRKKKNEAIPDSFEIFLSSEHYEMFIKGLIEDGVAFKNLAGKAKVDHEIFCFLVHHAFSPFISKYAEKLHKYIDFNNWLKGYCPVCGREPLIAKLEGEVGRKWMLCSLCHTEWSFKRLACPFCENDNQDSLRYFFVEEDESHRMDVCDKCKGYIKTIDTRKAHNEINLLVENLSTLALDVVAQKEGFQRNTFH